MIDKQSAGLAQAHRLGLPQQLAVEHCQTNCLEHTISLVLGSLLEPLNLTLSFPVVPAMLAHTIMTLATSGPPTMVKDLYQIFETLLIHFLTRPLDCTIRTELGWSPSKSLVDFQWSAGGHWTCHGSTSFSSHCASHLWVKTIFILTASSGIKWKL